MYSNPLLRPFEMMHEWVEKQLMNMNTWQKLLCITLTLALIIFIVYDQTKSRTDVIATSEVIEPTSSPVIDEKENDSIAAAEKSKRILGSVNNMQKEYLEELKNHFLDMALDVQLEPEGKTLYIKNGLFNDVWYRKFQTDKTLYTAINYYDKIIITDGFNYSHQMKFK